MFTPKDIEELFTYHTPHTDQPKRYQAIRESAKALAFVIVKNTQPSADQSAAIRHLREAVMTANAAIALEPPPVEPDAVQKASAPTQYPGGAEGFISDVNKAESVAPLTDTASA